MTNGTEIERVYPREFQIDDKAVTLRLMTPGDRDGMLAFARKLPPDDLLFLRMDITQPEAIDEWVSNLKAGRTHTVLAIVDGAIEGYATVHHNNVLWTRHMGEIRVLVSSQYRQHGLGKRLVDEVFVMARALGLQKLTVQMTPDQKGARATFEHLGFHAEALLADYVVDHNGKTRDLLIMSIDKSGFLDVEHLAAAATA